MIPPRSQRLIDVPDHSEGTKLVFTSRRKAGALPQLAEPEGSNGLDKGGPWVTVVLLVSVLLIAVALLGIALVWGLS